MRSRKYVISIVIIMIILITLLVTYETLLEKTRKNIINTRTCGVIRIKYVRSIKQTLSIVIDIPNRTDFIQLGVFSILPNKSMIRVGIYLTFNGTVRISMYKIYRIYERWVKYFTSLNDTIKDIDIGLLIILTAYSSEGVFTKIYAIPLNLYNITFRKLSVVVNIKDILTNKDMILSSDEVHELVSELFRNITGESIGKAERYHNIICANSRGNYVCIVYFFVWNMGIEYTDINTTVPLLAVKISKALKNVDKIELRELLETDKDVDILFSVNSLKLFTGHISHVLAGPLLVLHGLNVWLNYTKIISKIYENGSAIFIGFRGDLYFLKYNLYYCYDILRGLKNRTHCKILNVTMTLSFAFPYIRDNSISPAYGYLSNNFTIVRKYLNSSSTTYTGSKVNIDLAQVENGSCVIGLAIVRRSILISLKDILKVPYIVEIMSRECSFLEKFFNIRVILKLSSKYRAHVRKFYIDRLVDKYVGPIHPIYVTYLEVLG
ncbi:MAG: hypothetical protein GXO26_09110 [Crenarchaeota archaeon]|nr:hypothetical protein [Thermoproteota archaeon]